MASSTVSKRATCLICLRANWLARPPMPADGFRGSPRGTTAHRADCQAGPPYANPAGRARGGACLHREAAS